MDAEFTGSGGFTLRGCGQFTTTFNYNTEFDVRDIAYVKSSAQKGKLERITIRKITITTTQSALYPLITYSDTLNFFYQEGDLVDASTASTLISIYRTRRSASLENDAC